MVVSAFSCYRSCCCVSLQRKFLTGKQSIHVHCQLMHNVVAVLVVLGDNEATAKKKESLHNITSIFLDFSRKEEKAEALDITLTLYK